MYYSATEQFIIEWARKGPLSVALDEFHTAYQAKFGGSRRKNLFYQPVTKAMEQINRMTGDGKLFEQIKNTSNGKWYYEYYLDIQAMNYPIFRMPENGMRLMFDNGKGELHAINFDGNIKQAVRRGQRQDNSSLSYIIRSWDNVIVWTYAEGVIYHPTQNISVLKQPPKLTQAEIG